MSKLHTLSAVAIAVAFACSAAHAEDANVKTLEQRLEQSLQTIEALQKRVEQLERRTAPPAAAEDLNARVVAVESAVAQVEAATAAASQADTGLPIHGFADVGAGMHNKAAEGRESRGFNVGVFDLYMTPQIGAQVKALVEIAFEYGNDGSLAVDAERLQLGYVFSDSLTVWAGRFHTPYGYWNTAFHHGAQLQTTIARPRFLDFEDAGGILPAHSVGAWATGASRTALGKVSYDLYVVNGDRIQEGVLDFQALGDADRNIGVGLRASLAPGGTNWTVGIHGLSQGVNGSNADGTATGRVQLKMFGGFATYDTDDWEAMTEYYAFRNRDLGGETGTHASHAWYAQVGYNLNDQITPYARLESAQLNAADPYFTLQDSGRSYRRVVAGVRYNLTPKAAVKLEWRRTHDAGLDGVANGLAVQYSIRF